MNHDTKISFIVFLFIMAALTLSQRSQAAVNLSPTVSGYGSGMLTGTGHTLTAANDGYIKPAIVNVGGKAITVPATLRMAANAGQIVKTGLRITPMGILTTAALGYLASNGITPDQNGNPVIRVGDPILTDSEGVQHTVPLRSGYTDQFCYCQPNISTVLPPSSCYTNIGPNGSENGAAYGCGGCPARFMVYSYTSCANIVSNTRPAEQADYDALPNPLPALAPELPYAPYMPEGVPVDPPEYDFVPFSVPLGQPYTKPDGSTAQPMAKVSPNEELITVDTYDEPLTDPNGNPLADPAPQDTPEPVPEQKTDCEKFPESLGCAQLGTASDVPIGTESRSIAAIAPVSVGGVGACPAPLTASFMGQTVSFSYDMPCQFATSIKPLILALAWLSAGLIFIGGVRQ